MVKVPNGIYRTGTFIMVDLQIRGKFDQDRSVPVLNLRFIEHWSKYALYDYFEVTDPVVRAYPEPVQVQVKVIKVLSQPS